MHCCNEKNKIFYYYGIILYRQQHCRSDDAKPIRTVITDNRNIYPLQRTVFRSYVTGTLINGSPMPAGTYYYIIDLRNGEKQLFADFA